MDEIENALISSLECKGKRVYINYLFSLNILPIMTLCGLIGLLIDDTDIRLDLHVLAQSLSHDQCFTVIERLKNYYS